MANDLRPIPAFDIKADHRHQATIFTADLADKSERGVKGGKELIGFAYTPKEPLRWWYRSITEGEQHHWAPIPTPALAELDYNRRMVRVFPDQLEPEALGVVTYEVAVTEPEDKPNSNDLAVRFQFDGRSPEVPVHIDGEGTRVAHHHTSVDVTMNRTRVPNTRDEILWVVIRNSADGLSFNAYQDFMDGVFANPHVGAALNREKNALGEAIDCKTFAASSVDAYKVLRIATELFVTTRCGIVRPSHLKPDVCDEESRFGHRLPEAFEKLWHQYLEPLEGRNARVLPYLDLIRRKLGDISTVRSSAAALVDQQVGLLQDKLVHPVLLELIWSYWHEEAMLVQGFNSITRRFQNVRSNGERDPLANLELDPLRPVNNLLWGWVQDEQSQLSVLRRAHEYEHHYGFSLHGKALGELRAIDRRSKFLEAFHNLLWKCTQFFRQDDDTTVIADAFPLLNALKETHYLLAQGAHNQFGNLPSQARQDMLMQQWILSRPEVREFLGTRIMVPYPEAWMDRLDTIKTLKGWTDTSVVHFRDLATFGEKILLSIRWGAWSTIDDQNSAANWARYWRPEIQGYIHAYRVATSVDLTTDVTDQRQADTRFLAPSVHLRNRLLAQAPTR